MRSRADDLAPVVGACRCRASDSARDHDAPPLAARRAGGVVTAKSGRDWANEPWTKLFTRDSPRWGRLSFGARGLYCLLQRAADRGGRIEVEGEGATDVADALAHHLRAPAAAIERPLAELIAAGYVVAKAGWLSLPEHIEQQASRSSGTQRSKDWRAKHAKNTGKSEEMQRDATQGNAVQRDATIDQIDQIDQIEEKDKKEEKESRRAGAREAAAPPVEVARDPRAAEIATALGASSRFARLGGDVAEALLGHLGPLALQLDAGKIGGAIAAAALELEDGATERRQRQVLGWKFKDALEPQKQRANGKGKHFVQGDPNMKQFIKNVSAGRPSWDNGDGTP